jgi:Domain of unknown function (DUF222)
MSAAASNVLSFRPIDELEATLLDSWREVSKVTHRFLALLREFDLRQGWRAYGNADCAEWLNWKCGISRVTAQEKVRVAKALWTLPKIDAAFERGDLSYSKVRAVTRVATERSEAALLDLALASSASQVEAYCQRLRNGDAAVSRDDARRLHEARALTRTLRDDGSGTLHVELPRAELDLVLSALEFVGRGLPEDATRSLFAKGVDALLQMARDALSGRTGDGAAGENYQVMVARRCGRAYRKRRRERSAAADRQAALLRRRGDDDDARRGRPPTRRRAQASSGVGRTEKGGVRARSRVHVPGVSSHAVPRRPPRAALGRRRRDDAREPARAVHRASHAGA